MAETGFDLSTQGVDKPVRNASPPALNCPHVRRFFGLSKICTPLRVLNNQYLTFSLQGPASALLLRVTQM